MNGLLLEQWIEAPPETVFAKTIQFADAAETIEAITKMEMLTDGPVGDGTRFRETREMFGREATEEMEVAEFDPPRGYALLAESHGCKYRSVFRFRPEGNGTQLTLEFNAAPQTLMAKIMAFLTKPLQKKIGQMMKKDLEDLKRAIESPAS